jgi:hypothetical protein
MVCRGEDEERVALVVPEPHIEARLVLLYQAVLEHERLHVVADLDPLDAFGGRNHLRCPRRQDCGGLEVVGEALAKRLGLADVYDPPVPVAELVAPGCVGYGAGRRTFEHRRPVWRTGARSH